MNRVAFLVDGFNVLHSLKEAQRVLGRQLQWLDLRSLCLWYVRSGVFGRTATLQGVTYFSAYATFLPPGHPGAPAWHRTYVRALEATGVSVVLGRFRSRRRKCPKCGASYLGYEEKETDVAIAARIMELAISRECETIAVVTGDTDILPAIRTARRIAPAKTLWVASPFRRYHRALREQAQNWFRIRPQAYLAHQLPEAVAAPDGKVIRKPPAW